MSAAPSASTAFLNAGIYVGGLVQDLWILEVDGQLLVVDASYGADAITEQRDQLAAMVESLEFVAPAA